MDGRTALKSTVSFPVSSVQLEMIAEDRDINLDAQYTKALGKTSGFLLAKADMIRCFITAPNVSEGGVSISISDRKTIIGIANGIYAKYEPSSLIQEDIPTVTPIEE